LIEPTRPTRHQGCLEQPDAATRHSVSSVCTQAFTLRSYPELIAVHCSYEPELDFVPRDEFTSRTDTEETAKTAEHIARSPMFSDAEGTHNSWLRPETLRAHRVGIDRPVGSRQQDLTERPGRSMTTGSQKRVVVP
jgi:hypothetical protein